MVNEWYEQNFCVFEAEKSSIPAVSMTFDRWNAKDYLQAFHDAGIEAINAYVTDAWGYSYYDTKIGIRHPHLKADFFGDITKHASEKEIGIVAYYNLSQKAVLNKHPEWRILNIDGKSADLPCYNSPYRDHILDQLAEVSAKYKFHSVLFDGLGLMSPNLGEAIKGKHVTMGCYCQNCRDAYSSLFGREIPSKPDWGMEWKKQVEWRLDYVERFYEEMIAEIHKYKPGLPIVRNYGGFLDLSWIIAQRARLAKGEEYLSGEAGGPHGRTGDQAVMLRGFAGGKAGTFTIAYGFPVHCAASAHYFRLETLNILTHGGKIQLFSVLNRTDGTMDERFLQRLGEAFKEVAEKKRYIKGSSSLPYIGILHSDATKIFYGKDSVADSYGSSLIGAIHLLLSLHIPFDVVPEWKINPENLASYPILIMPNLACLSNQQAETLRNYVKSGGSLLATFETSLYDEKSRRLEDFSLDSLFGVKYLGRSNDQKNVEYGNPGSFLICKKHMILEDLPNTELWLEGHYIRTEGTKGDSIAYHMDPALATFPDKVVSLRHLPGKQTEYPAIHLNTSGKGRTIFATTRLFKRTRGYYFERIPDYWWLRRMLRGMLHWLNPNPPLWIEAPPTVEASFFQNEEQKRIIVQLLNRTNADTEVPLRDIVIWINNNKIEIKEAYIPWPKRTNLTTEQLKESQRIQLPDLKTHEIVILQM